MDTFKLVCYVPESHVESVKSALFAIGAGKQGNYDQCCWQVLGEGQFRPLAGSHPVVGGEEHNKVVKVPEYRIEMIFEQSIMSTVIQTLMASHPYEEPAFDIVLRHS